MLRLGKRTEEIEAIDNFSLRKLLGAIEKFDIFDYFFTSDFTIMTADEIEFLIYEGSKKRRLKIISPPAAEFPENFQQLTARSLGGHFKKHYLKMET